MPTRSRKRLKQASQPNSSSPLPRERKELVGEPSGGVWSCYGACRIRHPRAPLGVIEQRQYLCLDDSKKESKAQECLVVKNVRVVSCLAGFVKIFSRRHHGGGREMLLVATCTRSVLILNLRASRSFLAPSCIMVSSYLLSPCRCRLCSSLAMEGSERIAQMNFDYYRQPEVLYPEW